MGGLEAAVYETAVKKMLYIRLLKVSESDVFKLPFAKLRYSSLPKHEAMPGNIAVLIHKKKLPETLMGKKKNSIACQISAQRHGGK